MTHRNHISIFKLINAALKAGKIFFQNLCPSWRERISIFTVHFSAITGALHADWAGSVASLSRRLISCVNTDGQAHLPFFYAWDCSALYSKHRICSTYRQQMQAFPFFRGAGFASGSICRWLICSSMSVGNCRLLSRSD